MNKYKYPETKQDREDFSELPSRITHILACEGLDTKDKVKEAILTGRFTYNGNRIRNYGKKSHKILFSWAFGEEYVDLKPRCKACGQLLK
jgi:hypothetical protein